MKLACLLMRIYVGVSVFTHIHTYVSISFSVSLYIRMYAQKLLLTHILSYNCPLLLILLMLPRICPGSLSTSSSEYPFILLMLPRICAGSPKAMQQVDIVQSRMSLRCSSGKCNYILAPSCAHSLLEKKVNIIFFFFPPLVYVLNQIYKYRLLITFENNSGPTKCSRENACMCRLVSAFAAQEKMLCFFFSAHLCP